MNIKIVSVGLGNVASVKNMIKKVGFTAELLEAPPVNAPNIIILPGVGSYDNGIKRLKDSGWFNFLKNNEEIISGNTKLLGICLGMQLLCEGSEEGQLEGLGLISGFFKKFDFKNRLKVPHMGWNNVVFDNNKVSWAREFSEESRFYFVHSYYYSSLDEQYIIGRANYGFEYGVSLKKDNIMGFQFHPEKSHRFGKLLLSEVLK